MDVGQPPGLEQPEEQVEGFLARARARHWRLERIRAVLLVAAGLLLLLALAPAVGAMWVDTSRGARAAMAVFGAWALATLAAGLWLGWLLPRRRTRDDVALARWLRERTEVAPLRERLGSDLLSCVELTRSDRVRGTPSPAMVFTLRRETAQRLGGIDVRALFPTGPLRPAAAALAVAGLLQLLLWVLAPKMLHAGWGGLLHPPDEPSDGAMRSHVPLVGDVELTLTFPEYSARPPLVLPSSSGDLRAMPGTRVELRTRAALPIDKAAVMLEWEGGQRPDIVDMQLTDGMLSAAWTVDKPGRYRIRVHTPGGGVSVEATARQIELDVDQAPAVQLLAPADELDVANLRRVELAYILEDDYGLASAELVWQAGGEVRRKPVPLGADGVVGKAAQGKLLWDLADLALAPGSHIRYWLEARDRDNVHGPNIGRSREFSLRVWSPRERHEQNLSQLQALAEKALQLLAVRLPGPGDAADAWATVNAETQQLVVELGTQAANLSTDGLADPKLAKALTQMRDRLDRAVAAETKLLEKAEEHAATAKGGKGRGTDERIITELEEGVLTLADWLERERLESVLDVADEIATQRKRLADLLDQFAKTGDPRLKEEINRQLAAIERGLAELTRRRSGLSEDVLDRFIHHDALEQTQKQDCFAEVKRLFDAGKTALAQDKLTECGREMDAAASSLDDALGGLRGEKFSEEQRALDTLLEQLAELSNDQDEVAAEADRLFDRYAEKADELAKDNFRDAKKRTAAIIERLRRRLRDVPEAGLTPFADEELDIVERRLDDVERMVEDGDVAEAAAMSRQGKSSVDTVVKELEAAVEAEADSRFAAETRDSLDAVRQLPPLFAELTEQLQRLAPSPEQVLSGDEREALQRLRRRQAMLRDRTKKLSERAAAEGEKLPGRVGAELGTRLGSAHERMSAAHERMQKKDPAGARQAARAAAELLSKARSEARSAARQQQQQQAIHDEPVRIPGAEEYRAPERFREHILEAMKQKPPQGYDQQVRRYYEELIK